MSGRWWGALEVGASRRNGALEAERDAALAEIQEQRHELAHLRHVYGCALAWRAAFTPPMQRIAVQRLLAAIAALDEAQP